jgi:hypothetical protein
LSYACEGSGGGVSSEPVSGFEPDMLVCAQFGGVPEETREYTQCLRLPWMGSVPPWDITGR